eukprot:568156-Pyramimonas_sp.AAC.1
MFTLSSNIPLWEDTPDPTQGGPSGRPLRPPGRGRTSSASGTPRTSGRRAPPAARRRPPPPAAASWG